MNYIPYLVGAASMPCVYYTLNMKNKGQQIIVPKEEILDFKISTESLFPQEIKDISDNLVKYDQYVKSFDPSLTLATTQNPKNYVQSDGSNIVVHPLFLLPNGNRFKIFFGRAGAGSIEVLYHEEKQIEAMILREIGKIHSETPTNLLISGAFGSLVPLAAKSKLMGLCGLSGLVFAYPILSRRIDYQADMYAAKNGYKDELLSILREHQIRETSKTKNILKTWYEKASNNSRIVSLENYTL